MDAGTISKNVASQKSQMSKGIIKRLWGVTVVGIVILFCACGSSQSHVKSKNNTDQIIGVWKHVSSQWSVASQMEIIKVITKRHFSITYIVDKDIVASKFGTYTFDGETFTELVEFASDNQIATIGKKATVKVRFEDKKIYTSGKFENIPLNEVWERVE